MSPLSLPQLSTQQREWSHPRAKFELHFRWLYTTVAKLTSSSFATLTTSRCLWVSKLKLTRLDWMLHIWRLRSKHQTIKSLKSLTNMVVCSVWNSLTLRSVESTSRSARSSFLRISQGSAQPSSLGQKSSNQTHTLLLRRNLRWQRLLRLRRWGKKS